MNGPLRDKRILRFSTATLLFLMLCLGGYLSGYRIGFDRGHKNAVNSQVYLITYPVADLIAPQNSPANAKDFDSLIDAIVSTISPADWMENGTGEGEIQPFPSNMSLVVSQNQANHEAISALLAKLRQVKATADNTRSVK